MVNSSCVLCSVHQLISVCNLSLFLIRHLIRLTYYLIFRGDTWARVTVWLIIGVLVYVCYGRRHSSLEDAVYVPAAHANEIFRSSENYVTWLLNLYRKCIRVNLLFVCIFSCFLCTIYMLAGIQVYTVLYNRTNIGWWALCSTNVNKLHSIKLLDFPF